MNALLTKISLEAESANLQSRTVFWLLLFFSLNVADVILTNRAYAMLESVQLEGKMAELNPILQPMADSWLLILKGVFALVIMVGANKIARIPMRRMLLWACFMLGVVCIWNAKSIGLI